MATKAEFRIYMLRRDLRSLEETVRIIRRRRLTAPISRTALIRVFEAEMETIRAELAPLEEGRR